MLNNSSKKLINSGTENRLAAYLIHPNSLQFLLYMEDKNTSQSLLAICQQIQAKGGKPTVSLLRAKAPFKVGVADAIAAIKSFQAGSKEVVLSTSQVPQDPLIRISELESRVSKLEVTLANIEKRLNNSGLI